MTKASGFNDSIYGKSAAPISAVLTQTLEEFERDSNLKNIFSMRTSKNFGEKMTSISAMDGFQDVGENGAYPDADMGETFSKFIEHFTFKNRFSISQEMVEDSKLNLMQLRATKFAQAYGRTREMFGAALLTGATGTTVTFNGKKYDTTSADGVAMFSTQHPNFYKASQKQSNLYSNAFSVSVLDELESIMHKFKGEKGELLTLTPDTIVIPDEASIKRAVFEAIGSDKNPIENSSGNGFNYQYGRWNVIVWPYWEVAAGASTVPYLLMDSKFNELDGSAVWYDRVKLTTHAFVDENTDAAVYQGRARWSAGFNNWRGMIMGGVAGGTTLS